MAKPYLTHTLSTMLLLPYLENVWRELLLEEAVATLSVSSEKGGSMGGSDARCQQMYRLLLSGTHKI